MNSAAGKVIYFIQQELYDGKTPDSEGFYIFTRKEMSTGAGISSSTFDRNIDSIVIYFEEWCDLYEWAKYKEFAGKGEVLYTEVSYKKGALSFKRNPLTLNSEFSFLWALPPTESYFTYDAFDEKHRRRHNGADYMIFDSIPWSWNADNYQEELKAARENNLKHTTHKV